jgi:hypothetical protein
MNKVALANFTELSQDWPDFRASLFNDQLSNGTILGQFHLHGLDSTLL